MPTWHDWRFIRKKWVGFPAHSFFKRNHLKAAEVELALASVREVNPKRVEHRLIE